MHWNSSYIGAFFNFATTIHKLIPLFGASGIHFHQSVNRFCLNDSNSNPSSNARGGFRSNLLLGLQVEPSSIPVNHPHLISIRDKRISFELLMGFSGFKNLPPITKQKGFFSSWLASHFSVHDSGRRDSSGTMRNNFWMSENLQERVLSDTSGGMLHLGRGRESQAFESHVPVHRVTLVSVQDYVVVWMSCLCRVNLLA